MIKIAAGEPMPFTQDELAIHGARARGAHLRRGSGSELRALARARSRCYRPPDGLGIRVDGGVYQGATVTVNYDPMISKLIAWGRDRAEAIERLRRALEEFVVKGIKTGIPFHLRVLQHPKFIEGTYDTGFIEQHMDGGKAAGGAGQRGAAGRDDARGDRGVSARQGAGRARGVPAGRRRRQRVAGLRPALADARGAPMIYEVTEGKESVRVELREAGENLYDVTIGEHTVRVDVAKSGRTIYSIIEDGKQFEAMVEERGRAEARRARAREAVSSRGGR